MVSTTLCSLKTAPLKMACSMGMEIYKHRGAERSLSIARSHLWVNWWSQVLFMRMSYQFVVLQLTYKTLTSSIILPVWNLPPWSWGPDEMTVLVFNIILCFIMYNWCNDKWQHNTWGPGRTMTHTHKDRVGARAWTLFRGDDQALIVPQHLETMNPLEKY